MGKLIMWNMVTLDGRFEGEQPWSLDWHNQVWGEELERLSLDQLDHAGLLLFGRRTYEGMAAYWQAATGAVAERMNRLPKLVASRTLERAEWANTRLVRDGIAAEVTALKAAAGGDIFVFGSAELSAHLMAHGLFDEYRLGLVPVLLGAGRPLFQPGHSLTRLALVESRALGTGCVILRYRPA